jgi:hypothetical protein
MYPPPTSQSHRFRFSGIRSGGRLAWAVAFCFCLLTFTQFASALPTIAANSLRQATPYRFTHFPCEELGGNAAGASPPNVLQFARMDVDFSPRPELPRARAKSGVFELSLLKVPLHRRILPSSSDDELSNHEPSIRGAGQYCGGEFLSRPRNPFRQHRTISGFACLGRTERTLLVTKSRRYS